MEHTIRLLDEKIDALRQELAALTIRLVNIKSVQGEPAPDTPFGIGPKQVLDEVLSLGQAAGFYCKDYHTGVISLALEDAQPDLGIWLHGDVVPEGDGWEFDPYNAVEYKGCIIGRGATDNKGQLAAIFLLLKLFKELDIPLSYNPALYVGSNEENGKQDLVGMPGNPDAPGFCNIATPPALSLVPDSGFPVGYGGKGSVRIFLRSKTPLTGCRFLAGQPEAPGLATAVLQGTLLPEALPDCEISGNAITARTAPRHASSPDPNGNMITLLAKGMLAWEQTPDCDRPIWEFLRDVSLDVEGKLLGIAATAPDMKPLTVFTGRVDDVEGSPEVVLNVRYPDSITRAEILERVQAVAEQRGFYMARSQAGSDAYRMPKDTPIVHALCQAVADVDGEVKAPYTISGGTYAHELPNAYVFGTNGNLPPADFTKGRGGAHGIDECVSLDRLQRAMRIYARALLRLNDCIPFVSPKS